MRGLVLLVTAWIAASGCTSVEPPTDPTTTSAVTTTPTVTTRPAAEPLGFDGERAFDVVARQVLHENGTVRFRVPGTPGNDEAARFLADDLAALGWTVSWHHFNATYRCGETVAMHNVVAERAGASGKLVLLGAHYDTRPIAESDEDPENRSRPIAGANDGGSGVGVLVELARVLGPTDDAVRFVFFDGEDGGNIDACSDWLLGSQAYANALSTREAAEIKVMVLVDLVGDPGIVLPKEGFSRSGPGAKAQERIYETGAGLGYARVFTNDTKHGYSITDDHKPFLDRGIPAVDLIHLEPAPQYFPATHHTQADDLGNISATSLEIVGRTLEAWLEAGAAVA